MGAAARVVLACLLLHWLRTSASTHPCIETEALLDPRAFNAIVNFPASYFRRPHIGWTIAVTCNRPISLAQGCRKSRQRHTDWIAVPTILNDKARALVRQSRIRWHHDQRST